MAPFSENLNLKVFAEITQLNSGVNSNILISEANDKHPWNTEERSQHTLEQKFKLRPYQSVVIKEIEANFLKCCLRQLFYLLIDRRKTVVYCSERWGEWPLSQWFQGQFLGSNPRDSFKREFIAYVHKKVEDSAKCEQWFHREFGSQWPQILQSLEPRGAE